MSPSPWQQLSQLKPALPGHINIQRRLYGDEIWYLLQDKVSGRFHRFSPRAYQLLNLMDGVRTLTQIHSDVQQLPAPDGEETASKEELVELLQYLHVADLLLCDVPPSTSELFNRKQSQQKQKWQALALNPVIWRIPLGNPEAILNRLQPLANFISSRFVATLWCLVVGYALLQVISHWDQLTNNQLDKLMSADNLLLLWLSYPLLKILHELGHALFTKAWGGHINECGVVIAMGAPLPYVDATAATAFQKKSQRLMVSAAGMAVELFVAAVALLLWLQVEEGLLRSILFNLMVLGSISTLFFNGNPLLRFDGYHLLCDYLDAPNLGTRANRQLSYFVQNYGYGMQGLHSPAGSTKEAFWLITYALAAFCYRLLILAFIIMLAAEYFPTLGIALGIWLLLFQLGLPLAKKLIYLLKSPALANNRRRAIGSTAVVLVISILFIGFMPLPQSTRAEGVLWLPDDARIRVQSRGFIDQIFVADGEAVTPGQVLIQLSNPDLQTELLSQQATLREYQARYQQVWKESRTQAALFNEDIDAIEAEIALLNERVEQLTLTSSIAGFFDLQRQNPLGSFVEQGEQIAIIALKQAPKVRVALTQDEIGLVRSDSHAIEVKLSPSVGETIQARLTNQVPAATITLPSAVLGASGGGRISTNPQSEDGLITKEMIFLLDVELPLQSKHGIEQQLYGQRAYVKFEHSSASIGSRAYRAFQQQFLKLASR